MPTEGLIGKRIVICEDEGVTLLQLVRTLTRAGLIVVGKTGNGQAGVALVLQERPDIVLMDISMPGTDGLEAALQIMDQCPTCVVMLTADSVADHRERAQALGASGYLVKPITADHLLPALEQALQNFYTSHPR